jgi:hypothetical protein
MACLGDRPGIEHHAVIGKHGVALAEVATSMRMGVRHLLPVTPEHLDALHTDADHEGSDRVAGLVHRYCA